ncbi:MAG: methyltransferase domain-containing protein [Patescibacteria group bacterium]|nr:methyltransferase domain-containing protein [Patescibacteria group bacterium]MDE2438435.1 methyltransferase domain-containing protein [Patescibacteria group bacterium]
MEHIRLHLGCGMHYLEGYTNVDLPSAEQTVMHSRADIYKDIRELAYADNSVDEIRNHHLLEHFSRQEALKLLFQWRRWLRPGGLLFVETPDFERGVQDFVQANLLEKFVIARHLFGSQESHWAFHKDFWGEEKFRFVLGQLGFENIVCEPKTLYTSKYIPDRLSHVARKIMPEQVDPLHNIIVKANKSSRDIDEMAVARNILSLSLLGKEEEILEVWMQEFKKD